MSIVKDVAKTPGIASFWFGSMSMQVLLTITGVANIIGFLFVLVTCIVFTIVVWHFLGKRSQNKTLSMGYNEKIYRDKIARVGLDTRRAAIAEPILLRMRELEQVYGIFADDERFKSRMRLIDKIIASQKSDNDIAISRADDLANAELNGFFVEPKPVTDSNEEVLPKSINTQPFLLSADAEERAYSSEKAKALKRVQNQFIQELSAGNCVMCDDTLSGLDKHTDLCRPCFDENFGVHSG